MNGFGLSHQAKHSATVAIGQLYFHFFSARNVLLIF